MTQILERPAEITHFDMAATPCVWDGSQWSNDALTSPAPNVLSDQPLFETELVFAARGALTAYDTRVLADLHPGDPEAGARLLKRTAEALATISAQVVGLNGAPTQKLLLAGSCAIVASRAIEYEIQDTVELVQAYEHANPRNLLKAKIFVLRESLRWLIGRSSFGQEDSQNPSGLIVIE